MKKISLKIILAGICSAVLALGLTACNLGGGDGAAGSSASPAASAFNSIDITGVDYAKDFQLPDTTGKVRSLADFKGKAVVVFFGYTHCPDVCPSTMAEIKEAKRLLGKDGDKVQGIFITLDPKRDTPHMLSQYVPAFDPSFIGLAGSEAQTEQLAKDFHIYFKKVYSNGDPEYSIDHTAAAFVYDPQGRIRLYTRYNQGADKLAADLKKLLAE